MDGMSVRKSRKWFYTCLVATLTLVLSLFSTEMAFAGQKAANAPAQAGSKTVKIAVVTKDGDVKYAYNSNGLLKKQTFGSETVSYKYTLKGGVLKKATFSSRDSSPYIIRSSSGTLTYGSNGRVKKITSAGSHGSNTYTYTYTYKNGKVVKAKGKSSGATWTTKYSYSGSRITKATSTTKNGSATSKSTERFSYDKRGNVTKEVNTYGATRYKNSYDKNKRLKKVTQIYGDGSSQTIHSYSYKVISVPKKYAAAVKAQQHSITNQVDTFNLVFEL